MDHKTKLLQQLSAVDQLAKASKLSRMMSNPYRYVQAILFRELIYKRKKQSKEVTTTTFFGDTMHILLPSSTDIYLTKGKSHHSEIRLASYLIQNLNEGDTFCDIGAHYGYFTMLASKLVGTRGKVVSFEASTTNYSILHKNTLDKSNVTTLNKAATDTPGTIEFYEFPNLYSEYNSIDATQFENEAWFKKFKPKKIQIEAINVGNFFQESDTHPSIIKIDVEGAEEKVMKGLSTYLEQHAPVIIMEYLSAERGNEAHQKAIAILAQCQYKIFTLNNEGQLDPCLDPEAYLNKHNSDSDNIVFVKG